MPKIIQFLHTALEAAPQSENDAFIPVKIFEKDRESSYAFKQPAIQLEFLENMQTQGVNSKDCSLKEIIDFWMEIVNQIDEYGLKKGTWFKTPELKNSNAKQKSSNRYCPIPVFFCLF